MATLIEASVLIAAERGLLDWDRAVAGHGTTEVALAELAVKGISVGAHDLVIGTTALATGSRVATRDARSFPRIPGLTFVEW